MGRKLLAFLDWLLFIPRPRALSTTRSTKPSIGLPGDPYKYECRDLNERQLLEILRQHDQQVLDAAWRSGTWPKVLG